ncbi:MAG TPA: copper resistance protein B [Vicinamibacterales bacterium]|nr:copper resistance protein B [Vicinamibacterales bacterium]
MSAARMLAMPVVLLLTATSTRAMAQEPDHAAHAPSQAADTKTLPNLSERPGWPDPVADSSTYTFVLFDNAELQRAVGPNALRWDMFGWRGGDVHRFWFKSEGRATSSLSQQGSEYEAQALYGKLIAPFFDVQAGVRVDQRLRADAKPVRVYGVFGLQGLAPYRFEIEPALFLSQKGQVSARLTATYDILLSQRLILQPRFETNAAVQRDEEIGIGAGLNDAEVGVRLRFETRREFAPYIGVTWKESFGATHRLTVQEGGDPAHVVVVAGARMWF